MNQYHKIKTVWERDPNNKYKTLIEGKWATPELEYLKDVEWVSTEKVDGTNIRVMWNGKDVTFGGKTDNAMLPSFLVARLNELFYKTEKKQILKDVFDEEGSVCLYGEGYGAKIQKGGGNYISDGQDFVLFDVWIKGIWLKREDVKDIADKLGVKVVPIISSRNLEYAIDMAREGFKSQWGDFMAEGLVMRPREELLDRRGQRIITKIKHKDFFHI